MCCMGTCNQGIVAFYELALSCRHCESLLYAFLHLWQRSCSCNDAKNGEAWLQQMAYQIVLFAKDVNDTMGCGDRCLHHMQADKTIITSCWNQADGRLMIYVLVMTK